MNHIEIRHQIDVSMRAQQARQLSMAAANPAFLLMGCDLHRKRKYRKRITLILKKIALKFLYAIKRIYHLSLPYKSMKMGRVQMILE